MTQDHELATRVRAATDVRLDPAVTQRHAEAIRRAAAARPAPAPSPGPRARLLGRRLVAGVAAAALGIPGVAVAAENSLPGELLHPVKTVTTRLRAPLDPHLEARHRIEELEALLRVDADEGRVLESIARARATVTASTPPDLLARLEAAVSSFEDRQDAALEDTAATDDVLPQEPAPPRRDGGPGATSDDPVGTPHDEHDVADDDHDDEGSDDRSGAAGGDDGKSDGEGRDDGRAPDDDEAEDAERQDDPDDESNDERDDESNDDEREDDEDADSDDD